MRFKAQTIYSLTSSVLRVKAVHSWHGLDGRGQGRSPLLELFPGGGGQVDGHIVLEGRTSRSRYNHHYTDVTIVVTQTLQSWLHRRYNRSLHRRYNRDYTDGQADGCIVLEGRTSYNRYNRDYIDVTIVLTQAVQPCSHNRAHTGSTTVLTQPCSHRRYTVLTQTVQPCSHRRYNVLTQEVQPCSHWWYYRAHKDSTIMLILMVLPCSQRQYNHAHTDVPIVFHPGNDNVASVLSRSVGFVLHYWTRQLAN